MIATQAAFEALRAALEQAGIRYAVGGSWASTAYGEPRFTNDIDILADINPFNLPRLLGALPGTFYADQEDALAALRQGRPFNVIYMPIAMKFDLFPAAAYPLGAEELDRAILLTQSGLSTHPAPFVTPEDILLAKLHWYHQGGEVSTVQWRDIEGLIRTCRVILDREYLRAGAAKLGVRHLLDRALGPN